MNMYISLLLLLHVQAQRALQNAHHADLRKRHQLDCLKVGLIFCFLLAIS